MKQRSQIHRLIVSHHRRTWLETFVAWGLIAFYVLASGRALVPGLCATQAAMEAQCEVPDGTAVFRAASRGCCVVPREHGDGEKQPVTPEESHCAFCNLLIAHTDPPFALALVLLPESTFADHVPLSFQVAQEVAYAAAPNRAPPA